MHVPHTQLAIGLMTFVVRTGLDPHSLVSGMAAAVRGLDPELPLADVRAMEEVIDQTLARPRVVAVLLSVFAAMALVLAGVGVYGVMAFSVAERTHEIGVRMALGATPESVLRLVIGDAFRLVAIGVAVGLVAALALTQVLRALLFDTDATRSLDARGHGDRAHGGGARRRVRARPPRHPDHSHSGVEG